MLTKEKKFVAVVCSFSTKSLPLIYIAISPELTFSTSLLSFNTTLRKCTYRSKRELTRGWNANPHLHKSSSDKCAHSNTLGWRSVAVCLSLHRSNAFVMCAWGQFSYFSRPKCAHNSHKFQFEACGRARVCVLRAPPDPKGQISQSHHRQLLCIAEPPVWPSSCWLKQSCSKAIFISGRIIALSPNPGKRAFLFTWES